MNRWRKGIVSWTCGDTLYLSVPFTWLMDEAESLARAHKGPVLAGGPAVKLLSAPWAETPETCPFDVLAMHNPCATFTTRGCPNRCEFCAVPKIEGQFRELETWKPAPLICDNNLLACTWRHFECVVESLRPFPCADFNQGLDARRFLPRHAALLATLPHVKVRFAYDHASEREAVGDAITTARAAGLRDISVYALIGFRDTAAEAKARLDQIVEWGALPCPMRYQPLDATKKNTYVAPGWADHELTKMSRYYWRYRFWRGVPYEQFQSAGGLFPEAKP